MVEGFFFRRLTSEDGKRIRRLLVKSPPGLGKRREAIDCAIRYQAEQAGKDGTRLSVGDFNEAGVTARKQLIGDRRLSDALAECDARGWDALPLAAKELSRLFPHLWATKKSAERWLVTNPPEPY
jgi:hypothetical protein